MMFLALFLNATVAVLPQLGSVSEITGTTCLCEKNKRTDGWCPVCKTGYLAGLKIPSANLFEALDAHGHEVQLESFRCDFCKKAYADDGYCEKCRIGFVRHQAYMSRLTYEIARGQHTDVDGLPCETCKKCAAKYGWCEECGLGFVGNVVLKDRASYEVASISFQRLLDAIALLPKCQGCATAMFSGGLCPDCKLSYKTGQAVPMPESPSK